MFQSSLLMGGRFDMHDQFRELRLDVDNMSYEVHNFLQILLPLLFCHNVILTIFLILEWKQELLELGERIGHVSTGLKEDEIGRCIRKMQPLAVNELTSNLLSQMDRKCSICQVKQRSLVWLL